MITPDKTTAMMIDQWVEHQKTKPDAPADYLVNVDHLCRQMDAWQTREDAWRLLIGVRLAGQALDQAMSRDTPGHLPTDETPQPECVCPVGLSRHYYRPGICHRGYGTSTTPEG